LGEDADTDGTRKVSAAIVATTTRSLLMDGMIFSCYQQVGCVKPFDAVIDRPA
jgi:hypothetical protein